MEIERKEIAGLIEIFPKVFGDERGFFLETFHEERYSKILGEIRFVQDNFSSSAKGVLRGLHFQRPPFSQGKLVQVVQGSAIDVAVDIRKNSATYGKFVKVLLDSKKRNQFWIPEGFAHGFLALEDNTIFLYKCTNYYNPNSEETILWNDRSLQIDWSADNPIISIKDKEGVLFQDLNTPFL
jgi:dTDP-4-dehydrorhamnose 3,5-epimerase